MADNENITELPFSASDRSALKKILDKALFRLFRIYGAFFLALGYAYIKVSPGSYWKGSKLDYEGMTATQYLHVYIVVTIFFSSVFLSFLVRDFRSNILPVRIDIRSGKKYCSSFYARKYADPVYGKWLLFYPGKENLYIELSKPEFDKIGNGDALQLETACLTGEVLCLCRNGEVFDTATEFSFEDMPAPKMFRYGDE